MTWTVKATDAFWRTVAALKGKYQKNEYIEIIGAIYDAISELEQNGEVLTASWSDHVLEKPPFDDGSYHEFHIHDDDVLVVYYKRVRKNEIRMVGVYDHAGIPS